MRFTACSSESFDSAGSMAAVKRPVAAPGTARRLSTDLRPPGLSPRHIASFLGPSVVLCQSLVLAFWGDHIAVSFLMFSWCW